MPRKKKTGLVMPAWMPMEDLNAFIEMRKAIRAPLTDYALQLAIKRLERFVNQGEDASEVLQQSILNSWRGLFSTKNRGHINGNAKSPLTRACDDLIARARQMYN